MELHLEDVEISLDVLFNSIDFENIMNTMVTKLSTS